MLFSFLRNADLRFRDREAEASFLAHVEKKLVISIAVSYSMCFVTVLSTLPSELLAERARFDDPYNYSAVDARSFRFMILGGISLVSIFFLCAVGWWYFVRHRPFNWEVMFVSITTAVVVFICIGNQYTSAILYGQEPDETWVADARGSPGSVALTVDGITTLTCLFVPVRMHLKWIIPTFGVGAWCFCFGVLGSPFPDSLPVNGSKLFILTCASLWGAWRTEKEVRQNYLAQGTVHRKSHELEVQHAGASRILSSLCDVLLELGSDFNICEPSPRLAALLFYLTPQDLKGKNFCDIITSEEDRSRFVEALQGDSGFVEPTDVKRSSSMVQISLRDYHGREVSVYLYHARTFGLAGEESGHLVALVEAQERAPPDAFPLPEMSLTHIVSTESMEVDGYSSGSDSVVTLPLAAEPSADIAVWVNVVSPSLDIVRCSAGFTVFGPIAPETSLRAMVTDSKTFVSWVQMVINKKLSTEENGNIMLDSTRNTITLKLRTSPQSKVEFTTRCEPDLASFAWDDESDCVLLCLVFDQVKCRCRRPSSPHQGTKLSVRGPLLDSLGKKYFSL